MKSNYFLFFCLFLFPFLPIHAQIITGAEQMEEYLPLLKNKKVALLVNQTSQINNTPLPDTLLARQVNITKIFSPEHGFRGDADAGAMVKNGIDPKTKLPVISLYGKNKKPSPSQMNGIDVVIFDLQDVGARFYTYISSLEYLMEACAEHDVELIILDRPNPLGFIVDGPVLEKKHKSFVGMQAIPVVHGMTVGEYARMLIGEKWLNSKAPKIDIITCKNYDHSTLYDLPNSPSPNLKNMTAIYLYPSLCFFEGTVISLGRGTDFPFQMYGHPSLKNQPFTFKPVSKPGATNPPLINQTCHGQFITKNAQEALKLINGQLNLSWLLQAYQDFPNKDKFFNSFFKNLAGTTLLEKQIQEGLSEKEIRESWQEGLNEFKKIRKKYLLYPDFE